MWGRCITPTRFRIRYDRKGSEGFEVDIECYKRLSPQWAGGFKNSSDGEDNMHAGLSLVCLVDLVCVASSVVSQAICFVVVAMLAQVFV